LGRGESSFPSRAASSTKQCWGRPFALLWRRTRRSCPPF
jgi:hypothetical protein